MKRLIQRQIGDPLALALLEGKYADGDTVTVDVVAGPDGPPGPDGAASGPWSCAERGDRAPLDGGGQGEGGLRSRGPAGAWSGWSWQALHSPKMAKW